MPKYHFFKWPFKEGDEPMRTIIELYEDKRGEYRFRIKAGNGAIIAVSSEGYTEKRGAERAIKIVRASGTAAVKDLTDG